jgi:hypothetical protein
MGDEMADKTVGSPPSPPEAPPAETAYQDSGGGENRVQVTRNVPPKRVEVLPGNTVVYGDQTYTEGDVFVLGAGPVADQLAFAGHVQVVEHDASAEWNGEVGDAIRKKAGDGHNLAKYKHADGKDAAAMDVTQHRQQLGAEGTTP